MAKNLYDAHTQWAKRSADECFPNLEVLYNFTNARRQASTEEKRGFSTSFQQ